MEPHPAQSHARGLSQGKCRHQGTVHSHGERLPGEQLRSAATRPPAARTSELVHTDTKARTHILGPSSPPINKPLLGAASGFIFSWALRAASPVPAHGSYECT
jgi:hypothetical protein